MVPVCLKTFLGVLNVSRFRINNIMKTFYDTGNLMVEKRGGDRVSNKYKDKNSAVIYFINSLKFTEPHYCAVTNDLPAELSINKLWKMFNDSVPDNMKVKHWYF